MRGVLDDDRWGCLLVGSRRLDRLFCDRALITGTIHAGAVEAEEIVIAGAGFIRRMTADRVLIVSMATIIIGELEAGDVFLLGHRRPIHLMGLKALNLYASRTLIGEARVTGEAVLYGEVFIRRLKGSPRIVFRDPNNRFEEIDGDPSYEYLYEPLGTR